MQPSVHSRFIVGVVAVLWLTSCAVGFGALWNYANRRGEATLAPDAWPVGTSVVRPTDKPTLIMALHPQCPCSVASVHELESLLTVRGESIETTILLVMPAHAPPSWNDTRLTRLVATLPSVHIIHDIDAIEAHRFGLRTSGAALLYDPRGHVCFSGGITASRGHEGDNASLDTLTAAIDSSGNASRPATVPVFGCPLESAPAAAASAPRCKSPGVSWLK